MIKRSLALNTKSKANTAEFLLNTGNIQWDEKGSNGAGGDTCKLYTQEGVIYKGYGDFCN